MTLAFYILLGLVGVYLGVCAFYFLFQTRLLFVPMNNKYRSGEILIASDFEEVVLETPHDGRIHAIHIKAKESRGCMLYFHGNTGNLMRWAPIAEEFASYGFDLFVPDYRGYGKSTGERSEETLYSDALECYNYLLDRYNENEICIYGRSLGSAMAAWVSARTKPGAIVLETPFNNLIDVAEFHSKIIPVKIFLKYTFRSDLHIKRATSPVLIAHGTKDKLVPYKSGLRLYKSIKDGVDAEMLTIPGGKHGDLNGFPIFRSTLKRFFDKHFETN